MKMIYKYIIHISFIISFLFPITGPQNYSYAGKKNAAVLDFKAKGVATKQASIITDIFRGAVVKSGKYTVLDRSNMDKILTEQSFQQTGCTDTECAVKLGKLLSMQYMIVGTLSKLGSTYILSTEIISVEAGNILKSEDGNSKSIDNMITVAKDVALKLVGAISSSQTTITQSQDSSDKIPGDYFARGTNPNGSKYSGNVKISKKGTSYKFEWTIGSSKYYGVGKLNGNILTVDWGQQHPVIYKILEDGTLSGKWSGGKASEVLTPF